jgi:hypothetical protein
MLFFEQLDPPAGDDYIFINFSGTFSISPVSTFRLDDRVDTRVKQGRQAELA